MLVLFKLLDIKFKAVKSNLMNILMHNFLNIENISSFRLLLQLHVQALEL